jgi:hypothetical protein
MKFAQLLRVVAVCAFVALAQDVFFGQAVNFAQIQGSITDPIGATVAGAKIQATQIDMGTVRTTVSSPDGNYSLPNLPLGPYSSRTRFRHVRRAHQEG